ncbi:Bug family tripartite tricarboxylate transporter substrate binding protein [Sporomusa malonica]|uniref:Tripartite-type tricarboxylate transporter, receptor component TctC n=1 Tax=Sporomusa malonica TaxID=112901 RepID=A0A1W1Y8R0_9FIRM|nr:tripartite tricarboxylate transporter substrate binding protein [Sporomusa malonica]SMC32552.1 Tripartite-type tricarboxylate transporter, receptor component TctC [Sporomusa malonica]
MSSTPAATTTKFPDKPITVIVPFSVGGGLDLTARSLEKLAPKHLGQPLIVINKPGGAGAIGWNELAGASPDGYTIGVTAPDMLLLSLYGSGKYDYPTALSPLAQVASVPLVLAVQASQPWKTLNDLIEYARKNPGKLKFGHGGVGSFPHLVGVMVGQAAGITIEQVPFSGAGEVTAALLGGHIQLSFVNPMVVKEHVKNGTVRVLAATSEQRIVDPVLSQVPTFKEQGLDVVLTNWYGVAVPKETPIEVKNKLAKGLKTIITDPEFIKNMNNVGLQVEYLDPQESQAKWLANSQKLSQTLNESGILEKIKAQRK